MWRPTVRYHDVFKDYIDELTSRTTLDKNQLMRLALFTAAHSPEFHRILNDYKTLPEVQFPLCAWSIKDKPYWEKQNPVTEKGIPSLKTTHSTEKKLIFRNQGKITLHLS